MLNDQENLTVQKFFSFNGDNLIAEIVLLCALSPTLEWWVLWRRQLDIKIVILLMFGTLT